MFLINHVEIVGFWGKYKVVTSFHPDVNIFIGKNGTGKTTFINILSAVLKCDLKSLLLLEFTEITITLKGEKSRIKTISVSKLESPEKSIQEINFKLGSKNYPFSVSVRDIDVLSRNTHRRTLMSESISELENEIAKLINISSLTVHRIPYAYYDEEYSVRRRQENYMLPMHNLVQIGH